MEDLGRSLSVVSGGYPTAQFEYQLSGGECVSMTVSDRPQSNRRAGRREQSLCSERSPVPVYWQPHRKCLACALAAAASSRPLTVRRITPHRVALTSASTSPGNSQRDFLPTGAHPLTTLGKQFPKDSMNLCPKDHSNNNLNTQLCLVKTPGLTR